MDLDEMESAVPYLNGAVETYLRSPPEGTGNLF
jgi:hypothetical protein